jgi:hypothetical protein
MADVVMILLIFVFTAVTLLWVAACDRLMRTDSTREGPEAEHAGGWSSAVQPVQRAGARE